MCMKSDDCAKTTITTSVKRLIFTRQEKATSDDTKIMLYLETGNIIK